jgi:hypothetical protein
MSDILREFQYYTPDFFLIQKIRYAGHAVAD